MWGTGILKGFGITMRNWARGPITVQYPEQRLTLPERARWTVTQKFAEDGSPKCTACLICERECPDFVLKLEVTTREDKTKHIDRYVYEVGACMMCGLCVAACPYDAIEMSHEYELATIDRDDLVRVLLSDVDAASPRRAKSEGGADA
jgi:NADH-quinone oxidoreductase subunit I